MKKVLSVLSLIAILGMSSPAMAAPGGPGGLGGPGGPGGRGGHGGGHHIHAGVSHHRPPMMHPPRHHGHGGVYIHAGYPRHSYWGGYGVGYWGNTWCDYRLGCYDPYFYYPPRPYVPMSTVGLSIRL